MTFYTNCLTDREKPGYTDWNNKSKWIMNSLTVHTLFKNVVWIQKNTTGANTGNRNAEETAFGFALNVNEINEAVKQDPSLK